MESGAANPHARQRGNPQTLPRGLGFHEKKIERSVSGSYWTLVTTTRSYEKETQNNASYQLQKTFCKMITLRQRISRTQFEVTYHPQHAVVATFHKRTQRKRSMNSPPVVEWLIRVRRDVMMGASSKAFEELRNPSYRTHPDVSGIPNDIRQKTNLYVRKALAQLGVDVSAAALTLTKAIALYDEDTQTWDSAELAYGTRLIEHLDAEFYAALQSHWGSNDFHARVRVGSAGTLIALVERDDWNLILDISRERLHGYTGLDPAWIAKYVARDLVREALESWQRSKGDGSVKTMSLGSRPDRETSRTAARQPTRMIDQR
jgi:hypothetical protein